MTALAPELPGLAGVEPDRVKVRMYKHRLGDCLLLILEKDGADSSHILIDCGVLQGTKDAPDRMKDAVANIYATTKGKPLDLVVVTHEHHDHISGFDFAADTFKPVETKKRIDTLWMAWTEDLKDPDAIDFQARFGKGFAMLGKLGARLAIPDGVGPDGVGVAEVGNPLGLAGFSGPLTTDRKGKKVAAKVRGSRKIYGDLWDWSGKTEFLSPGNVLRTPGALGLPAYVLGPPRDLKLLTKALPTAGKPETYLDADSDEDAPPPNESPFPRQQPLKIEEVETAPLDGDGKLSLCRRRYFGPWDKADFDGDACQTHRQIDNAERSVFATLALKMDNNTNNTSLVLAFELPGEAGTMLFAADAQVGNWLSWDTVKFRKTPSAKPLKVTAADLLARTRLYKVGHHGSHNATLREQGLDRMLGVNFVAMVPTDAEFALKQSSGWLMPNPRVEEALQQKGLVLRGDVPLEKSLAAHREKLGADDRARFEQWQTGRFSEGKLRDDDKLALYVEYLVYDRARDNPSGK